MDILERTARFFVTGEFVEHLLAQWVTMVMIVVHWGLGVAVLAGGIDRFSLPTYQPLIDLTCGNIWIWGVLIILSGLLMMVPMKWPNVLGLWIGMAWMVVWAVLFSVSMVSYPSAAATPGVAYAGFAMINAALLTARVIEKPLPRL